MINSLGSIGATTKTEQIDTKVVAAPTIMMQNQSMTTNAQHHGVMQHISIGQSSAGQQTTQQQQVSEAIISLDAYIFLFVTLGSV